MEVGLLYKGRQRRARRVIRPITSCISLLAAALLFFPVEVWGADVTILGGNVGLTISSATAGQQPNSVTNEICQLQWSTLVSDSTKKVTAQTSMGAPSFALSICAVNVSAGDGSAAGEVTLSTAPLDFVLSIPAGIPASDPGSCTLRYTASATAADGTGTNMHTITFTIVDQ